MSWQCGLTENKNLFNNKHFTLKSNFYNKLHQNKLASQLRLTMTLKTYEVNVRETALQPQEKQSKFTNLEVATSSKI